MALRLTANRKYPSVPAIGVTIENHTAALQSMKEALEISQRRTTDILNSHIRVQDLIDLGLITFEGNTTAIVGADLSEIAEIGDLSGAALNDFLRFDGSQWVNDQLSTVDITQTMVTQHQAALSIAYSQLTGTPSIPSALDDLSDVDLTTTPPVTGDVLTYDGSEWIPEAPTGGGGGGSGGIETLNDLLDVDAIYPSAGDVLTWDGYGWVNEAPTGGGAGGPTVGAILRRVADQSVATSTNVAISWDTEDRDDDDFWSSGSPTDIVVPTTGWYSLSAAINYKSHTNASFRYTLIELNGDTIARVLRNQTGYTGSGDSEDVVTTHYYLEEGDVITVVARQTSGFTIQVSARVQIVRIS